MKATRGKRGKFNPCNPISTNPLGNFFHYSSVDSIKADLVVNTLDWRKTTTTKQPQHQLTTAAARLTTEFLQYYYQQHN